METGKKVAKLAFWNVGRGKLASEGQALFEQAQIEAKERNAAVTVTIKIKVNPPEKDDARYGKISYSTDMKIPARESMEYTTELIDGVIVADAKDQAELLQLSLALEFPKNVEPFNGQAERNG